MSFGALRRTAVRQNAVLDWAANTYANMLGGQLRKYGATPWLAQTECRTLVRPSIS